MKFDKFLRHTLEPSWLINVPGQTGWESLSWTSFSGKFLSDFQLGFMAVAILEMGVVPDVLQTKSDEGNQISKLKLNLDSDLYSI